MTDQTQTSNPATIAPAWDVTATATVTGAFAARYAHAGLSTALATIADEIAASDIAVEAHRRDPANEPYGQTLAREIGAELDRRHLERIKAVEDSYAQQQAADGLDDQDEPVVRAELYIERDGDPTVWAHHGTTWWYADADIDDSGTPGWYRSDPRDPGALRRLPGWVEIPQATTGASEEQQ